MKVLGSRRRRCPAVAGGAAADPNPSRPTRRF